jgi:hypothetical protein
MLLRNVANTFTGQFTNTNTANRTYTLKDASGTLAFTSDITGTNSGTNTGDQTLTIGGTTSPTIALSGSNTATFSHGTGITLGQSGGTITITNASPDQTVSFTGGTNVTIGGTYPSFTITDNSINSSVATLSSLTSVGALTTGSIGTGFVVKGVTMTLGSDATGDVYYRSAGGVLTRLAVGTSSQALIGGTTPTWGTPWTGLGYLTANQSITLSGVITGSGTTAITTSYVAGNINSLNGLSYASTSFVKMTSANTFTLDTNTYLTSLSGALLATGATTGATSSAQPFTKGISVGTASNTTGNIAFNGITSGTVNLSVADASGTWTMKLPTSAGSNTNVLTTDGSGNTSWSAAGSGDMTLAGVQTVTGAKTFGTIGGAVGKLILAGSTSGSTILNAAATAGSTTITLPGVTDTVAVLGTAQTFTASQTFYNSILANNAITASGNAATVPITYKVNTVTNNSAATLTITLTTTSAVDRQLTEVLILDASAVAQTITWVNTENSSVSAPTTSNGSTTLPLAVQFQYNNATSKWRCIGWA